MKGINFVVGIAIAVAAAAAGAAGPEWSTMTVDNDGPVGMMCNIALDGDDRPHVVYWDRGPAPEERSLRYAYYDGNDWNISYVEKGVGFAVGEYGDIAIDSSGHPHVSYSCTYEYNTGLGDLRYAYYDGSSWRVEVVDDCGLAGYHTSIALDSQGRPHISYRNQTGFHVGVLKHAYYDGSNWRVTVVESSVDPGFHSSIAIDSHDNPHIAYRYEDIFNRDNRAKYAHFDGSDWHVETVDTSGVGTALALDARDRPHISYTVSDTKDLKYAYKDGGRWRITTVDADGYMGHRTGIALGENGVIHISYHEYVPEREGAKWDTFLKYAYSDGSSWHTTYVDAGPEPGVLSNVGIYNSIALDSYGDPHIVYVYFPDAVSDEYLKYACLVGSYLNYFTAVPRGYDGLALEWLIRSVNPLLGEQIEGFNLYRREKGEEEWLPVNEAPLAGGSSGSYDDGGLACLRCYEYSLEGIIEGGKRPLGVTEGTTTAPRAYVLCAPRPNPSSSNAVIAFELMDRADVDLSVFDLSGRKVATVARGWFAPGGHECACDVSALAPGVYVYRMTAGDWAGAKKMVVVK